MTQGEVRPPDLAGWPFLLFGAVLVLVPIAVAIGFPNVLESGRSDLYLRIIASLGAGIVGSFIPGALQINLPFAKAAGALGLFLITYAINPPGTGPQVKSQVKSALSSIFDSSSYSARIEKWLYSGGKKGNPPIGSRDVILRTWILQHTDTPTMSPDTFIEGRGARFDELRKRAVVDLGIPGD
jgi:hypothetical protein